jgi:hypothetical protein
MEVQVEIAQLLWLIVVAASQENDSLNEKPTTWYGICKIYALSCAKSVLWNVQTLHRGQARAMDFQAAATDCQLPISTGIMWSGQSVVHPALILQ